eukprot:TRINITY_DN6781_c0_g1_i1.p1 TRINITY_DN6781_c0_g1~~TRINITY_DN6781_c0_g1_i1.p1  ORF type:complete len:135 (+),score=13.62 TRINITY_DN6781_c0_g1_i1:271-675(+)
MAETLLGSLPVDELVKLIPELVRLLDDSDDAVRRSEVSVLKDSNLPAEELLKVAPKLVHSMDTDTDYSVKHGAASLLGQLPAKDLEQMGELVRLREGGDDWSRSQVSEIFRVANEPKPNDSDDDDHVSDTSPDY